MAGSPGRGDQRDWRPEFTPIRKLYQFVPRPSLLTFLSLLSARRINNLRVFSRPYGFDFNTPLPVSIFPSAAPIGIHLHILKNDKNPPICAFLTAYNKLPKL
jgi:hypothetical protein